MVDLTGYTLTFADEFNTRSISQTGGQTTWSNMRSEWQLDAQSDLGFGASSFVDASSGYDPFRVADGLLTITARPDPTPYGVPGNWESGLITTQGNFSQTYGYFEMRADLSDHPRAWDAFWLLPDEPAPNPEGRPGWQEIDVVEHYGNHNAGTYSWLHTTDPHTDPAANLQVYGEFPSQLSGFHTYGMAWTAETITFYYDGVEIGSKPTPSDMHGSMYVLTNLAVQPGAGGADQTMDMKIDYIRVYAASEAPEASDSDLLPGSGAATLPPVQDDRAAPAAPSPDQITLQLSQDAYLGDAQFIIKVDGLQIGAVQTASSKLVSINGDYGAPNEITIEFVNDVYHGSAATDRNLYVEQMTFNGVPHSGASGVISNGSTIGDKAVLNSNGSAVTFHVAPADEDPLIGGDHIDLQLSQDAYLGDAQFILRIDGQQVGPVRTAADDTFSFSGNFGTGPKEVSVEFVNDLYHGSAETDRNLYVQSLTYNGETYAGATGSIEGGWTVGDSAFLYGNGSIVSFGIVDLF